MAEAYSKLLALAKERAAQCAPEELEILQRMVSIDSGSGDLEGNAKVVEIVDEVLRRIEGIQIEHVTDKYGTHVIARLKPENSTGKMVISCHLDTVFQKGDVEKHPFRVEGDRMYGLGIVDCKGGFVVSAHAVKLMQEEGLLPNKEIVMLYTCDEEIMSPTSYPLFEKEAAGADMAFVFEPSREDNGALTSRKGVFLIDIKVTGRSAHSGVNYLAGASATMELARKMLALESRNIPEKNIFFNVANLQSSKPDNVVPDFASAIASVRVSNDEEMQMVRDILKEVSGEVGIEGTQTTMEVRQFVYPMPRTEGNVKLFELVKKAAGIMGQAEFPEQSSGGSGDAGWFSSHGIPSVDALGPYMYKIHHTEESGKVSSIEEKTALFCVVLGLIDSEWK